MGDGLLGAVKRVLMLPVYVLIALVVAAFGMVVTSQVEWSTAIFTVRTGQTAQSHQIAEGIA